MAKYVVTGGLGFLGSHLTDELINRGHEVIVIDNLQTGSLGNKNEKAELKEIDIEDLEALKSAFKGADGVFHCAAIARTPWTIKDPVLCHSTNVTGTFNVLEAARLNGIKRVVLSSSCIVYAGMTPYRASKEALEIYAGIYYHCYGLETIALRYSNLYGTRQSEEGESPNVFAALRKAAREQGKIFITGDGEQTRDFTHVSDVVEANILAMESEVCGVLDICTGIQTSLNTVAKYFNAPIEYIPEREGDVKFINQDPKPAEQVLGWKAKIKVEDGIKDVL